MSEMDPHDRIDMTGPWAGFGFQAGHMFTPEGHQLEACDMAWWSLTCNIVREWRLMMEEARPRPFRSAAAEKPRAGKDSSVICLRDALRKRREKRLGVGDPGPAAEASNVVHMHRGPRPRTRG
jgi:Phage protein